ncbi:MAG: beta-ketoacyl-acyl-carrier-protein synthase [Chloroflexota bacterium]
MGDSGAMRPDDRRAVITGYGAITPIGNSAPAYWEALVAGVSGAGPITHFDASQNEVRIAAEVKGFDPLQTMDMKMARRMSRFVQFAVAAATEAIEDAGLADIATWDPERRDRVATVINTGGGGIEQVTMGSDAYREKGGRFVSAFAIPALSPSMGACMVSMKYGLTGAAITQAAACATGVLAFQDALRLIRSGEADVVIAGGVEAPLLPMAFAALANMGALSKRNDDPTHASRPFDKERDGFVFGEGGAVFVVESLAHARARGAKIRAELLGAGATADAFHISAPEPTGRGAAGAMSRALRDGGATPEEVTYIVAHGTSTPLNDLTETKAIKRALGEHAHRIPVSSPKSAVGHLLGGAGAVAGLAAIKAIETGTVPPTINLETPDPECDLDYVPKVARVNQQVDRVLINGFGFGGQNASALFGRLR